MENSKRKAAEAPGLEIPEVEAEIAGLEMPGLGAAEIAGLEIPEMEAAEAEVPEREAACRSRLAGMLELEAAEVAEAAHSPRPAQEMPEAAEKRGIMEMREAAAMAIRRSCRMAEALWWNSGF